MFDRSHLPECILSRMAERYKGAVCRGQGRVPEGQQELYAVGLCRAPFPHLPEVMLRNIAGINYCGMLFVHHLSLL